MVFSVDVWSAHKDTWNMMFSSWKDLELSILEIGSFEGRSTTWILENILCHPKSKIVCIDNFHGLETQYHDTVSGESLRRRFIQNISPWSEKVTLLEGDSWSGMKQLDTNVHFDLIYIDGCHRPEAVLADAVTSWPHLKFNGVMVFDDYLWKDAEWGGQWQGPKKAIDAFLEIFKEEIEIISIGLQVFIKKYAK